MVSREDPQSKQQPTGVDENGVPDPSSPGLGDPEPANDRDRSKPRMSEGVRLELLQYGEATDPLTGKRLRRRRRKTQSQDS